MKLINFLLFLMSTSAYGMDLVPQYKPIKNSPKKQLLLFIEQNNIQQVCSLCDLDQTLTRQRYGNYKLLPVHVAARAGHSDLVDYLLEKDPDTIKLTDMQKRTVLFYASLSGNTTLVQKLACKYPKAMTKKAASNHLPIHASITANDFSSIHFFLEKNSFSLEEIMDYAIRFGSLNIVAAIYKKLYTGDTTEKPWFKWEQLVIENSDILVPLFIIHRGNIKTLKNQIKKYNKKNPEIALTQRIKDLD